MLVLLLVGAMHPANMSIMSKLVVSVPAMSQLGWAFNGAETGPLVA